MPPRRALGPDVRRRLLWEVARAEALVAELHDGEYGRVVGDGVGATLASIFVAGPSLHCCARSWLLVVGGAGRPQI